MPEPQAYSISPQLGPGVLGAAHFCAHSTSCVKLKKSSSLLTMQCNPTRSQNYPIPPGLSACFAFVAAFLDCICCNCCNCCCCSSSAKIKSNLDSTPATACCRNEPTFHFCLGPCCGCGFCAGFCAMVSDNVSPLPFCPVPCLLCAT